MSWHPNSFVFTHNLFRPFININLRSYLYLFIIYFPSKIISPFCTTHVQLRFNVLQGSTNVFQTSLPLNTMFLSPFYLTLSYNILVIILYSYTCTYYLYLLKPIELDPDPRGIYCAFQSFPPPPLRGIIFFPHNLRPRQPEKFSKSLT